MQYGWETEDNNFPPLIESREQLDHVLHLLNILQQQVHNAQQKFSKESDKLYRGAFTKTGEYDPNGYLAQNLYYTLPRALILTMFRILDLPCGRIRGFYPRITSTAFESRTPGEMQAVLSILDALTDRGKAPAPNVENEDKNNS
jgi:hypothetical protein